MKFYCLVKQKAGAIFRKFTQEEQGVLALEATISLTFFTFFMLALYSLVTLFMAQYMIGHALSVSSQSLSLETYGTDKLGNDWSIGGGLNQLVQGIAGEGHTITNYSDNSLWFKETYTSSERVQSVCRTRFAAYMGGSVENADSILKKIGVVNGLDGMDFSETKLDGSDLIVSVSYKIRLIFGVERLGLGEFNASQSVCSRLWGSPSL